MVGYGHKPHVFVAGFDDESHDDIHRRFATLLDEVLDEIAEIKRSAHAGNEQRPQWPMIVFRTPKGWTGPDYIDGKKTDRLVARAPGAAGQRAGHPGAPRRAAAVARVVPRRTSCSTRAAGCTTTSARSPRQGDLRMSDNPHANGGLLLKDLRLPDFRDYAVDVPVPGGSISEAPRVLGDWLTDVIRLNPDNFRIFGPDETASNRLQSVFADDGQAVERRVLRRRRRRAPGARGPRAGDAQRAPVPGLARGLPADRAGTACSTATRRSSTSSTRCSTSTPSGSRSPTRSRGAARSRA